MTEPSVDLLEAEWGELAVFGSTLSEADWKTPSDLPGWTVQDNYAHIIGIERMIMGEAAPQIDLGHLAHVRNAVGASNEQWVEARRALPGEAVLDELLEVTSLRITALRELGPADFERVGFTPIGEAPYREFMNIRVMDCWMHEQDVRRGLDQPGHQEGPIAEHCLGRCIKAMGFVVGKKAGAPEGSTIVFDLTGPMAREVALVVRGRAEPTDEVPADPSVRLRMGTETFWCLTAGRVSPEDARARGTVTIEGDVELGRAIIDQSNVII